jgi:hypothetical protein
MESHIIYLNQHCRICGNLFQGKGNFAATTYAIDGSLQHGDLSVAWKDLLLDLKTFAIDTFQDDPAVHPSYFCNYCYLAIAGAIRKPSTHNRIIFNQFSPTLVCDNCNVAKRKPGRRCKSKTMGGQGYKPDRPKIVYDLPLATSIVNAHQFSGTGVCVLTTILLSS